MSKIKDLLNSNKNCSNLKIRYKSWTKIKFFEISHLDGQSWSDSEPIDKFVVFTAQIDKAFVVQQL